MRLIDADALEDKYFDIVDVDKEPLWVIDKDEIDDAPTVCNIKNAEWLEHHNQTRFYVKCSNCKTLHDEKSNYCPFCGTRMNGDYKGLTKIVIGENDVI